MSIGSCVGRDPRMWDVMSHEELYRYGANHHPDAVPRIREAVAVCGGCPLQANCLRIGLERDEQGVWGGTYLSRQRLRAKGKAA